MRRSGPRRIGVVLEHRFQQTPDGACWTETAYPYRFWRRYLVAFEVVRIMARVRAVDCVSAGASRVDGPDVEVAGLPYYVGPTGFFLRRRQLAKTLGGALESCGALLLRVPSPLGSLALRVRPAEMTHFAVEVVGDPWDVFAPGASRHPLRGLVRRHLTRTLRRECAAACVASYVTRRGLQRRYPATGASFATSYSDVELGDDAFVARPRIPRIPTELRLAFVGGVDQLYKAPDVLIAAIAGLTGRGIALHLDLVGDGRCRSTLEAQASALGIRDRITFHGQLTAGVRVREVLDKADVFVLPSYQEGLPRAMIEAMARGLPCIGTSVGGVPELLTDRDMVPPGDLGALSDRIHDFVDDPVYRRVAGARNLERAREFREASLVGRRREMYEAVRRCAEGRCGIGAST